jgi:hypothetical protein
MRTSWPGVLSLTLLLLASGACTRNMVALYERGAQLLQATRKKLFRIVLTNVCIEAGDATAAVPMLREAKTAIEA